MSASNAWLSCQQTILHACLKASRKALVAGIYFPCVYSAAHCILGRRHLHKRSLEMSIALMYLYAQPLFGYQICYIQCYTASLPSKC
jgi:hypothetical protein